MAEFLYKCYDHTNGGTARLLLSVCLEQCDIDNHSLHVALLLKFDHSNFRFDYASNWIYWGAGQCLNESLFCFLICTRHHSRSCRLCALFRSRATIGKPPVDVIPRTTLLFYHHLLLLRRGENDKERQAEEADLSHDLRPTLTHAIKLWSALRSPCRFPRNSRQSARTTRMWSLPAIQEEERKVSSRPGNSRVLETNQKCRYHDHG